MEGDQEKMQIFANQLVLCEVFRKLLSLTNLQILLDASFVEDY